AFRVACIACLIFFISLSTRCRLTFISRPVGTFGLSDLVFYFFSDFLVFLRRCYRFLGFFLRLFFNFLFFLGNLLYHWALGRLCRNNRLGGFSYFWFGIHNRIRCSIWSRRFFHHFFSRCALFGCGRLQISRSIG